MSRSARSIRRKSLIAVPLRKHLELLAPKLEPEDAAHPCATEGQKERPERSFIRSENGSCIDLRESTDHKSGMEVLTAETVLTEAGASLTPLPPRSSSPVGWDGTRPTNKPEVRSVHQRTASQPGHHVFRSGRLCYEAKATWEHNNTAACVRVLALPRPSPPWPAGSPAGSTGLFNTNSRK
jgi:hypothetical protein